MLKTCEIIIHNGKPLPIIEHDQVIANISVPSKRQARLAFDRIARAVVCGLDEETSDALAGDLTTLRNFMESR